MRCEAATADPRRFHLDAARCQLSTCVEVGEKVFERRRDEIGTHANMLAYVQSWAGSVQAMTTVWQVQAGDSGRRELYRRIATTYGIAMIGVDDWSATDENPLGTGSDANVVRQFRDEMRAGDVLVLAAGHQVELVGTVLDDELLSIEHQTYPAGMQDLDGWCMPIARRVSWADVAGTVDAIPMRSRFSRLSKHGHVVAHLAPASDVSCPSSELPDGYKTVDTLDEVVGALPRESIHRIEMIREYLRIQSGQPRRASEHEMMAHAIVPLLRALGIGPERVELERPCASGRADVVVYTDATRTAPLMVLEAKKRGKPGLNARAQAFTYVNDLAAEVATLDVSKLRYVATSDGCSTTIWDRHTDTSSAGKSAPVAYLNLLTLTPCHPLLGDLKSKVPGASAAFEILSRISANG